jgi:integrase
MLYTMLVLAYCAGLRLGEIVRLTLGDINLEEGILEVRDSKFFKSRRLPLSKTAIDALRNFLQERLKTDGPQTPVFVHGKGRYSYTAAGMLLRDVIRKAGLHKSQGRGPRFHDLRHTFVVHRMTQWYREGINPQGKLVHLSTYLGHRNIHSTLVYLTITQELLQQANLRFRTAESGVLKVIKESANGESRSSESCGNAARVLS